MKRKMDITKIKSSIYSFIVNNRLFISFVILMVVLGFLLHMKTIGGRVVFKAIVSDLLVTLLIAAFANLIGNLKTRYKYYLIWLIFFTLLVISNTIYYGFYQSFLSINLIGTASMVGQVNDSLVAKLHIKHFTYIIIPIIFIIYNKILVKNKYYDDKKVEKNRHLFKRTLLVSLIIFLSLLCTVSKSDGSRFLKLWNRESVVNKYGIYVYTINDLIQSVHPRINTLFGYDEAAKTFREYYACKWEKKNSVNEYTNIFKDKNVLFIHAESIQNFVVDLKINGKEITPNLNKLAHSGIYFKKFYPQISVGTSSDTEFTLLTGLMPSSSGTVFVNYYDRTYKGMPEYFSNIGYYTFSAHANNDDYWNRAVMHNKLGYKDFYAKERYNIPTDLNDPDYIGLGLSDKSFYKQFIPILNNIKNNNSRYFGTIITLSNHSPFNDIEKYGEFDLSIPYKYIDEEGNLIEGINEELNNSSMGGYLKSTHYADEALGELFELLKDNNLLDNTIIILYGDHEARLSKKEFDLLYNYNVESNSMLDEEDEKYYDVYGYNYDLLKNTPFIIWSNDEEYNKTIDSVMGMYDVLPTIANMFGFNEKYSLGNDIFGKNDKIVVFPNGNVLTDKVYYSDLNEEYITFTDEPIDTDYINNLKEYADKILDVSNGIVTHDLIKRESDKIGECIHEK